ncbi:hypothetical protein N865_03200 [Intrasporangium oryzae NRRL B-24470]|uniref:DUF2877 domain-containing protein n=1 Tax=Intrasporangium oryzae NRRL B-24470 TaxID=1386089 RepID=W9GG59_9MICO|nr:hypothetical protein N865_03200 [Intrasporangium oryzae NRRL B-24470]
MAELLSTTSHGPSARVAWPAAVSPLVADVVAGPQVARPVLASFPTCLYLAAGSHEQVLAVLAADALALPIGLHLALPSTRVRWGVEPGAHVVVGGGRVRLPHADVVAVRLSRPSRVQALHDSWGAAVCLPDPGVLGDRAQQLVATVLEGGSAHAGVRSLIGAGRGLTPSGDDALCGVLLTLGALDLPRARRAHAQVASAVRSLTVRTTSLSAALLLAAAQGYAVPDVARLVSRVVGTRGRNDGADRVVGGRSGGSFRPHEPAGLVDRVLAIGHTSGRDLLAGVSGALRALDAHTTSQEGTPRG